MTGYLPAPTLAGGLREAVITAWRRELATAGREGAAVKVCDYIAAGGFDGRFAAARRGLDARHDTLRKAKRYCSLSWSQREQQVGKTRQNLVGMVSGLVRVGAELPSAALAELPEADVAAVLPAGVPALPSAPIVSIRK